MKTRQVSKVLITSLLSLGVLLGCASQMTETGKSVNQTSSSEMKSVYERIDPTVKAPLEHLPQELSLITKDTVLEARAMVHKMLRFPDTPSVNVKRQVIATNEGDVPVYIYRPDGGAAVKPAILWTHGGGYIMGRADSNDFAGNFAKTLDAVVVSVDYRLAPEHPFPAGHNDSYAAFLWLAENSTDLGVDPKRIAIGGDSAGAGMAAGVALHNRDANGPEIALQLLIYPMLDNLHDTPSGSIEDYPVWNRQTSFNAWEMYLGGKPGLDASPYASPSRAQTVGGLPKTYLTIGTVDLFRDEVIHYAQRLMAAGVDTELAVYPGAYHGSQVFVPDAEVSQKMISGYINALKTALHPKN